MSICRTMRPRPAPSAARIAASRPRAAARASSRFAVLAQAIRSSSPTAREPSRSATAARALARLSCSAMKPRRQLVRPHDARERGAEGVPGRFRFARRLLDRDPGSQPADDGVVEAAARTRTARAGAARRGRPAASVRTVGITPTTVCGLSASRTEVPITSGFAPNAAPPERVGEDGHVGTALDVHARA